MKNIYKIKFLSTLQFTQLFIFFFCSFTFAQDYKDDSPRGYDRDKFVEAIERSILKDCAKSATVECVRKSSAVKIIQSTCGNLEQNVLKEMCVKDADLKAQQVLAELAMNHKQIGKNDSAGPEIQPERKNKDEVALEKSERTLVETQRVKSTDSQNMVVSKEDDNKTNTSTSNSKNSEKLSLGSEESAATSEIVSRPEVDKPLTETTSNETISKWWFVFGAAFVFIGVKYLHQKFLQTPKEIDDAMQTDLSFVKPTPQPRPSYAESISIANV